MKNGGVKEAVDSFSKIIDELHIDIKNDSTWPTIANELLKEKDAVFQLSFWEGLNKHFLKQEKKLGHTHKGQIYWILSLLYLQKGNIKKTISYLLQSKVEDDIRDSKQFTSSKALLSILHPLFYRFGAIDKKKMTPEIEKFYEGLSESEKQSFADLLFKAHNNSGSGQVVFILPEYFTFLVDEKIRKIAFETYIEVQTILTRLPLPSYFTCVFSIGSILEAMIDDTFSRNDEKIWKLFKSNNRITKLVERHIKENPERKGVPLASSIYPMHTTLNTKIKAFRMMADEGISPIPKYTILQMTLIGEYRDLIHPRRRLDFNYEADFYVASYLFNLLSQIASTMWNENLEKNMGNS
jgi:hypothetical protein